MSLREDIVRKIFMAHDAEEVFNIRLPNLETKDILFPGTFEKNGSFSIRSTYKLALDRKIVMQTNSSHCSNNDRKLLNTIQKANVPPKYLETSQQFTSTPIEQKQTTPKYYSDIYHPGNG
jgi:hypothetical protein